MKFYWLNFGCCCRALAWLIVPMLFSISIHVKEPCNIRVNIKTLTLIVTDYWGLPLAHCTAKGWAHMKQKWRKSYITRRVNYCLVKVSLTRFLYLFKSLPWVSKSMTIAIKCNIIITNYRLTIRYYHLYVCARRSHIQGMF